MRLAEEAALMVEDAHEVAGFGAGGFGDVGTEDPRMSGTLPLGRFA